MNIKEDGDVPVTTTQNGGIPLDTPKLPIGGILKRFKEMKNKSPKSK